jgi:hypothetical protein
MSDFAIDFDGTCVTHEYPKVGKDIEYCEQVLNRLLKNNHRLILNTMRSGKELNDAVEWFKSKNIALFGVNKNPTQESWTSSPKIYAHKYIDDAAIGCPLIKENYVDWKKVEILLEQEGFFNDALKDINEYYSRFMEK